MSSLEQWVAVDKYFAQTLLSSDPLLDAAFAASAAAGLPQIQVSPAEGRLLHLLARISGARRILEIGTLGGYSTICLARALPPDGSLISLELNDHYAAVAGDNLQRARLGAVTRIVVGPALDTLPRLAATQSDPFDFIFIDADKSNIAEYFDWSLKLSRPGTVIVFDNVVRKGAVVDPDSLDPSVQGVRRLMEKLAAEPRVTATAIQTIGPKGWDGFAVALVTA